MRLLHVFPKRGGIVDGQERTMFAAIASNRAPQQRDRRRIMREWLDIGVSLRNRETLVLFQDRVTGGERDAVVLT
jgi:hypothetical protein